MGTLAERIYTRILTKEKEMKERDQAIYLLGQLQALQLILPFTDPEQKMIYNDYINSIVHQYKLFLDCVYPGCCDIHEENNYFYDDVI